MTGYSGLMQKLGIVITSLSVEFIELNEGDRIRTVEELSKCYCTARGTVQSALKFLKEHEALEVESRGHLGTFIKKIDYKKLLELSGIKSLVGVMPLPYSKRYEGLATGLYKCLNESEVNINLAFMRGSNHRLKALEDNRYDFAITSRLTAEYYLEQNKQVKIINSFGDYSYVNEHVLIVSKDYKEESNRKIKVGIDKSSIDQFILTKEYFKDKDVEYIELSYSQFVSSIYEGNIEAAIWNLDDLQEKNNEMEFIVLNNKDKKDTEAVIIANKNNQIVSSLFSRTLNKEHVKKYQKLVLEKRIIPQY